MVFITSFFTLLALLCSFSNGLGFYLVCPPLSLGLGDNHAGSRGMLHRARSDASPSAAGIGKVFQVRVLVEPDYLPPRFMPGWGVRVGALGGVSHLQVYDSDSFSAC